jgi:hypothetical protein
MPRSAIETGMVDWVLAVNEMPRQLLEYQKIQGRVRLPEEKQPVAGTNEEAEGEKALRQTISFLQVREGRLLRFARLTQRSAVFEPRSCFVPEFAYLPRPCGATADL